MATGRNSRCTLHIPPWHHKRLILWAYIKGVSKTALAQNILQARIEVNEEQITRMLQDLADDRGIEVTKLEQEILAGTSLETNKDD